MSGKDMTKYGGAMPPSDLEARLAALRKDVVLGEERTIRLGCTKTNDTYIAVFKRKAEGELFTVAEIRKEPPPKPQGGVFGAFRVREQAAPATIPATAPSAPPST